jgi:voltage-gated potassium channel Kch
LVALGRDLGHIDDAAVSLVTAVGVVTITASSYLIIHGDALFRRFGRHLRFLERHVTKEDGSFGKEFRRPVIIVGAHRTGQSIAASLPKDQVLIIDFDPEIMKEVERAGYEFLFGDVADPEIFEKANFGEARLAVSTSPDFEDNLALLAAIQKLPARPKVIVRAETEREAKLLYDHHADYVFLPNFTAGQYLGKTVAVDPQMKILDALRKRDLAMLKSRRHFLVALAKNEAGPSLRPMAPPPRPN